MQRNATNPAYQLKMHQYIMDDLGTPVKANDAIFYWILIELQTYLGRTYH